MGTKHVLKCVSLKNKTTVSVCPMFHSCPLPLLSSLQNTKFLSRSWSSLQAWNKNKKSTAPRRCHTRDRRIFFGKKHVKSKNKFSNFLEWAQNFPYIFHIIWRQFYFCSKVWRHFKILSLQFHPKYIYHTLAYVKTNCILSFWIFFLQFLQIFEKWCFEPKKVDEKYSNGHNFPLTEPNFKYLSILERSCYVKFEKNVNKKNLGQKMNRVTSCSFFLQCSSPKKHECHIWFFLNFAGKRFDMLRIHG
jgi:hypothetical protein